MADIELLRKIQGYNKPWCYQYERKRLTLEEDKKFLGWDDEFIASIKLDEFEFSLVTTDKEKRQAIEFNKRYEWLKSVDGLFISHIFQARYKGVLGGIVIMAMPYAFSALMGEGTREIERLIARGSSASWTPKNLASRMLSWCMRWMVKNTPYRLFYGYSDPSAKELGTIYQSLNFYYLGKGSGRKHMCVNPYDETRLISDRQFRSRSFYKRYAKDLGIEWGENWSKGDKVFWENIPDDIGRKLRARSKELYEKAEKIDVMPKGKYVYVLGATPSETKRLRKKFTERNKTYEYPKDRNERLEPPSEEEIALAEQSSAFVDDYYIKTDPNVYQLKDGRILRQLTLF